MYQNLLPCVSYHLDRGFLVAVFIEQTLRHVNDVLLFCFWLFSLFQVIGLLIDFAFCGLVKLYKIRG